MRQLCVAPVCVRRAGVGGVGCMIGVDMTSLLFVAICRCCCLFVVVVGCCSVALSCSKLYLASSCFEMSIELNGYLCGETTET